MAEVAEVALSFESPDSSSVEGASYDPATLILTVTLRPGKTYTYAGVDPDKWKAFLDAHSKGKFFQSSIRPFIVGRKK